MESRSPSSTPFDAGYFPDGSMDPSGERLRRLVATCRDAVIFLTRNGRIAMANPAACSLFGYTPDELAGADVRMLMPEPYSSRHQEYIENYERTGKKAAIGQIRQVSARKKNGQEFPMELSVTQLSDEIEGARYGAFIRDVSEKVRLQSELMDRERSATIGTTASMLVHEIGNPLNNMALQLQVLRRKLAKVTEVEGAADKVDSCLGEVERLSRLVQEFRALSGRVRLNRRRLELTRLVEGVPNGLMRIGPGISVVRDFQDQQAYVLADGDKFQQVLLNLCDNAVDAMPNGGTLTLRTMRSGNDYLLEIVDTGTGIEPGVDIFEPFVTTKPNGTGLGLAICSEIIREHGGTITYESSPQGTTFRLRIPLVEKGAEPSARNAGSQRSP